MDKLIGKLENIIRNDKDIDKPSIKNSIIENTDRIRRNYELIRLEKISYCNMINVIWNTLM